MKDKGGNNNEINAASPPKSDYWQRVGEKARVMHEFRMKIVNLGMPVMNVIGKFNPGIGAVMKPLNSLFRVATAGQKKIDEHYKTHGRDMNADEAAQYYKEMLPQIQKEAIPAAKDLIGIGKQNNPTLKT